MLLVVEANEAAHRQAREVLAGLAGCGRVDLIVIARRPSHAAALASLAPVGAAAVHAAIDTAAVQDASRIATLLSSCVPASATSRWQASDSWRSLRAMMLEDYDEVIVAQSPSRWVDRVWWWISGVARRASAAQAVPPQR